MKFWEDVTKHGQKILNEPQLIGGDFNTPLNFEGGRVNLSRSMHDLRNFVDANKLINLNLKGKHFTWSNRQCGRRFIQRKLDRFMVTEDWIE